MATYREQIKQFFAKTFKGNFIEVCKPKQYLLSLGLPKLPIYIRPSTLSEKVKKHLLTSDMIKNLPTDINAPILAFKSDIYTGGINLIIQKKNEEGLLCVCLHPNIRANKTEINEIASIHGRQFHQLEMWANLGLLLSGNVQKTKKALQWLAVTSAKSERFIAQLSAANIQNNSLSGAKADTFYQSVMDKYKKRSRLEKDWIRLGLTREKEYIKVSPFPSDWERVINQEIAQKVKDGDIFGRYRENYEHIGTNKFIKKYYRVYTAPNGDLYYYEIDEEGNIVYMNETNEKSYLSRKDEWNKLYNLRIEQAIVNGKLRLYFGNKATAPEHQYFSIFIKPRTTAPTNSRLRLLRIQAQAKIKLQQQRMR